MLLTTITGVLSPHSVNATPTSDPHNRSSLHFRLENDIFGGTGRDQDYSSGLSLAWRSPDLTQPHPSLPAAVQPLYDHTRWLQPSALSQQTLWLTFEHNLFTPQDKARQSLIRTDRPYAATLTFKLAYQARQAHQLHTNVLTLGVVGPAALGKPLQNSIHNVLGSTRVRGWDNQLHNEPLVQLAHERRYRMTGAARRWSWDTIGTWGVAVGNLSTHGRVGGEIRYGLRLPDNFGSGRLAGVNTTAAPGSAFAGHVFLVLETRAIARDITLDGNTWRHSHRVDTRRVVTELGYGLALHHGRWHITLARYHRTREFNGQSNLPVFGSLRVGYQF